MAPRTVIKTEPKVAASFGPAGRRQRSPAGDEIGDGVEPVAPSKP